MSRGKEAACQGTSSTLSEFQGADAGIHSGGFLGRRGGKGGLFRRLVVLDTDLIRDAGMAVAELRIFSVTNDLS